MKLTRNLKIFIALNIMSTSIYAWTIFNEIGMKQVRETPATFEYSLIAPILYGLFWWISTSLLLKYDDVRSSRKNLNLQYHAAMSIIVGGALIISAFLDTSILGFWILIPLFALTFSYFIHWFFTRNAVKGIEAKNAFK